MSVVSDGGGSPLSDADRMRLERGQHPKDAPLSRKGEINTVQWMHRNGSITTWESENGRMWRGWTVPGA